MRIIREPQITSGFLYDQPFAEASLMTHCGEATAAPDHHLGWHQHPGDEILYLCAGRYLWQVGSDLIKMGSGDVLVVRAKQRHRTASVSHVESHHLWLGAFLSHLGDSGQRIARELDRRHHILLHGCHEMEGVFRGIITQVASPRPLQARVARTYMELLTQLIHQHLPSRSGKAAMIQPHSYPIQKVLFLMSQHLAGGLTLKELLAAAGLGITQFSHRFRQEVGRSPFQHYLYLRLLGAREALLAPDASITRTAVEYGFSSSQHFATQFRRAFATSPTAWREQNPGGKLKPTEK